MLLNESDIWRVLDANFNRASEGFRTIEDLARLVAENVNVARRVKKLRHRVSQVAAGLDRYKRLAARSAATDAGTKITETVEQQRASVQDIVAAAAERSTQALRNLEEFSKLVSIEIGEAFKQVRYEAYDTLADAELQLAGFPKQRQTMELKTSDSLYLLVDCELELDAFRQQLSMLAEAGVDLFQLRDKQADGARLIQYARAALESLRSTNARLIVNDRVDIALASGAVGVHLGQEDMSLGDARQLAGDRLWIGISTHNLEQALAAQNDGADYIGCGPTFPSRTKTFAEFAGTDFLREVAANVSIPFFAIGGIDANNLAEVLQAGCSRVAVGQAILGADDPVAAAKLLKSSLSSVVG